MLFRVKNGRKKIAVMFRDFLAAQKFQKVKTLDGEWEFWKDPSAVQSRKKIDTSLRQFVENYPRARL